MFSIYSYVLLKTKIGTQYILGFYFLDGNILNQHLTYILINQIKSTNTATWQYL